MTMTPGLGLSLLAMFAFGVSDLVYKRSAAAGVEAGEFIMLQAWAFCPAITLYAWLTGTLDPHPAALWGALAGFFLFFAAYNFIRSLESGAVSTYAPIFRLNFTLTAALAIIILGESLTLVKLAALSLALIAVWLLLKEAGTEGGRLNTASLTRVLIATVAMALTNFFYKVGLQHGVIPETMVAEQAWTFCTMATLLRLYEHRRIRMTTGAWRYSTMAALALLVGFVSQMHGLAVGPASVLVPVAQMSFVFTALLGAILFREKLDMRKCAGLAVAVAALALFAVS
jgi:drug/metabolite transporter (DMT)-like permease